MKIIFHQYLANICKGKDPKFVQPKSWERSFERHLVIECEVKHSQLGLNKVSYDEVRCLTAAKVALVQGL